MPNNIPEIMQYQPLNKLLPNSNLLQKGHLILFRGSPGAGKTNLALFISILFSRTNGLPQNKLVYYCIEEDPDDLFERFQQFGGIKEDWEKSIGYFDRAQSDPFEQLRQISKDVLDKGVGSLVIIDSIQSYMDFQDPQKVRSICDDLRAISHKRKSNIILIAERLDPVSEKIDYGHFVDIIVDFRQEQLRETLSAGKFINRITVKKARNHMVLPFESILDIQENSVDILLPLSALQREVDLTQNINQQPHQLHATGIKEIDELISSKKGDGGQCYRPGTFLLEGENGTRKSAVAFHAFLGGTDGSNEQYRNIHWISIERPEKFIHGRLQSQLSARFGSQWMEEHKKDFTDSVSYISPSDTLDVIANTFKERIVRNNEARYKKVILSDLSMLYEQHGESTRHLIRYATSLSRAYGFTLFAVYTKPVIFGHHQEHHHNFNTVLQSEYTHVENEPTRRLTLHIAGINRPLDTDKHYYEMKFTPDKIISIKKIDMQLYDYRLKRFVTGQCSVFLFNFANDFHWKKCAIGSQEKYAIPAYRLFCAIEQHISVMHNKIATNKIELNPVSRDNQENFYANLIGLVSVSSAKTTVFTIDEPWLNTLKKAKSSLANDTSKTKGNNNGGESHNNELLYVVNHSCLFGYKLKAKNNSSKGPAYLYLKNATWQNLYNCMNLDNKSPLPLYLLGETQRQFDFFLQICWPFLFKNNENDSNKDCQEFNPEFANNDQVINVKVIKEWYSYLCEIGKKFAVKPLEDLFELVDYQEPWVAAGWLTDVQTYKYFLEYKGKAEAWHDHVISLYPQTIDNPNGKKGICLNGDWSLSVWEESANPRYGEKIAEQLHRFRIDNGPMNVGLPITDEGYSSEAETFATIQHREIFRAKEVCKRRSQINVYNDLSNSFNKRFLNEANPNWFNRATGPGGFEWFEPRIRGLARDVLALLTVNK